MQEIADAPGIFCDAHLVDEAGPRFLSLWGRDTAMQELLARLTVLEKDGGLRSFWIGRSPSDGAVFVPPFDPERLQRLSARKAGTLFGDLVQVWLYDEIAIRPDRANGRAMMLFREHESTDQVNQALWALIRQTLWVPVLDHWRDRLMQQLADMGCMRRLSGWRVDGVAIDLSDRDRVEAEVSALVRTGVLTLDDQHPVPQADAA